MQTNVYSEATVPLKEQMFMMVGEDKYVVISESKVLNEWETEISHILKTNGQRAPTQVRMLALLILRTLNS